MICVSNFLRGEPADFDYPHKEKQTPPAESSVRKTPEVSQGIKTTYYANYELFSTFTPDEYDRLTMRFPTDDDLE